MGLYVKSEEVRQLAEQVAAALRVTKTEAIRRALTHELDRVNAAPHLSEQVDELIRSLHAKRGANPMPADKAFIDSLYE